jgi:ABC-type multidrug transport system ATPase subunit
LRPGSGLSAKRTSGRGLGEPGGSPSRSDPFLRARRVSRRFGAQVALESCDLDVCSRDALALVGPNGAGKSTLLSLLAGAIEPTSGRVERAPGVRVGWVPQRPAYYERLTARENLALFARLEGEHEPAQLVERLLVQFDVPPDRPAATLSVGNRQRLNVAVAFLGSPQVLLLDEPTASLDPGQRQRLWQTVEAVREAGGAVVFATQNVEEIGAYASRVAVLQRGVLTFAGGVDEYERVHAAEVFS